MNAAVGTSCGDVQLPYQSPVSLPDEFKPIPDSLKINMNKSIEIQESTKEQSNCQRWHEERKHRLTASKFSEILKRKSITSKYVHTILNPKPFKSTSTSYGISNEKKARQLFIKKKGLHVHDCGLCVNPEYPYLGATPDGIVCDDGKCGIIEIKCPYSARDMNIEESLSLPGFCLEEKDGKICLKNNHAYYYQIQGQLMITGVDFCDFIVYTRKEMHIERINQDVAFMNKLVSDLSKVYFRYFHECI